MGEHTLALGLLKACLSNYLQSACLGDNWLPEAPRCPSASGGSRRGVGCAVLPLELSYWPTTSLRLPVAPKGPVLALSDALRRGRLVEGIHPGGAPWRPSYPGECLPPRPLGLDSGGTPTVLPLYFLTPRSGSPTPSPSTGAPAGPALPTAQPSSMSLSLGACSPSAHFVQPPQAHTNQLQSPTPHRTHPKASGAS